MNLDLHYTWRIKSSIERPTQRSNSISTIMVSPSIIIDIKKTHIKSSSKIIKQCAACRVLVAKYVS